MRAARIGLATLLLLAAGALSGCGDDASNASVIDPRVLPASAELTTTVALPEDLIGEWEQDNTVDGVEAPVRTSLEFRPDGTGLVGSSPLEGSGATKIVELTYEISGSTVTLHHEYGVETFSVDAASSDYLRIRTQQESPWLKSGHLFRVQ